MLVVTPCIKFNLTIDSRTQFSGFAVPAADPSPHFQQWTNMPLAFLLGERWSWETHREKWKRVTCQKMLWQRPTAADQRHLPPITLSMELTKQLLTQNHTSLTAVSNDAIPLFVKFSDCAWERHSGQATVRRMDTGQTSDLIYFTTCTKRLA